MGRAAAGAPRRRGGGASSTSGTCERFQQRRLGRAIPGTILPWTPDRIIRRAVRGGDRPSQGRRTRCAGHQAAGIRPAAAGGHRRGATPVPPRVGFARAGARGNFRQREDAHPHELEAKERAREELQRALEAQIEEKRRRKEEEKLRLEREELAEERRLAEEQERLREAFERERAEERQKALERERAEEEAYQRAANDRSARARAPGLAANARGGG